MTVQELYDSVALLGFDTNIEYVNAFYFAANRAILEVCKIRPVLATLLINHYPLKNSVNKDVYHYDGKTEYIVSATDSKAFYFECDGNGDVYVENKPVNASQWQTLKHIALQSKRQFIANKGLIKDALGNYVTGDVRIRFAGSFSYNIRNVALYEEINSDSEDDIDVCSDYVPYKVSELVTDFLSLQAPPVQNENVFMDKDYFIENRDTILFPVDKVGSYKVEYQHKPTVIIQDDTANQNVDLPDDLAALMPNLIAAYVWAEDEPEKAEYYLNQYEKQAMIIRQETKTMRPAIIQDVLGW